MNISKIILLIFKDILLLLSETNRIEQSLYPIPATVRNINLVYLIVPFRLFV